MASEREFTVRIEATGRWDKLRSVFDVLNTTEGWVLTLMSDALDVLSIAHEEAPDVEDVQRIFRQMRKVFSDPESSIEQDPDIDWIVRLYQGGVD